LDQIQSISKDKHHSTELDQEFDIHLTLCTLI